MRLHIFLLLLPFFLLIGCHEKKGDSFDSSSDKMIYCDLEQFEDVDFHAFLDSVRYVKLDTDSSCLINSIAKTIYYNECFYIADGSGSSIFVFNNQGKFLFKLNEQGGGPEEYISIADFTIDRADSTLTILDLETRKLSVYTLKDLKFLKKSPLPVFFRRALSLDNQCYLGYDEKEGVYLINEKEGTKDMIIDYSESLKNLNYNDIGTLYWTDEGTGIFSTYDNCIYHYNKGILEKKNNIEYSKATPADFKVKKEDVKKKDDLKKKPAYVILSHHEKKDWIFQLIGDNKDSKIHSMLYSKKEGKSFMIKRILNFNDILFSSMEPSLMDDCIIFSSTGCPFSELQKMINDYSDNNWSENLKKIIFNSKEDDNPILQILYFKKS